MKILLCCAGGFSTNMLMQNMRKVVQQSAKLNDADFDLRQFPQTRLKVKLMVGILF